MKLFGGMSLQPAATLASILADYLETDEGVLCKGVHKMLTDDDATIHGVCSEWFDLHGLTKVQYATSLLQIDTPSDGLLLALVAAWANIYVGVLHADGMWSSCPDGSRSSSDLLVALTAIGFWRLNCARVKKKVDLFDVPSEVDGWNMMPLVIGAPVKHLDSFLLTMQYEPKMDAQPQSLINVVSDLMKVSPREYRERIMHWMEDNMLENLVVEQWWKDRNQDWLYYFMVLQSNCRLDGLEFWSACVATHTHVTLVQQDGVWSTRADGPNDEDYVLMLLSDGVVYCNITINDSDSGEDFDNSAPAVLPHHPKLACCQTSIHNKICEHPVDLSVHEDLLEKVF